MTIRKLSQGSKPWQVRLMRDGQYTYWYFATREEAEKANAKMARAIGSGRRIRKFEYTSQDRVRIIKQLIDGEGVTANEIARKYDVSTRTLARWRRQYLDGTLKHTRDPYGYASTMGLD